jgi:uracil-DNA glycosylase family 4
MTIDDDPRAELARLVADLRAHVSRHARAGAWAAPGGASPVVGFEAAPAVEAGAVPVAAAVDTDIVPRGRLTLGAIRSDLGECTRCKLSTTRNKIVFGVGAEDAALMFVGEAPGADEDRTGEPFVGKAGQLLDKMIEAMGWTRAGVYIANVLKCRPPGNRNPEPDEVAQCHPFLLVALGRPAANTLLGNDAPISALRGKFHDYRGIRLMPTFHPAYLLRSPDKKRDAWNDLKMVMAELDRLGITPPGAPRG